MLKEEEKSGLLDLKTGLWSSHELFVSDADAFCIQNYDQMFLRLSDLRRREGSSHYMHLRAM